MLKVWRPLCHLNHPKCCWSMPNLIFFVPPNILTFVPCGCFCLFSWTKMTSGRKWGVWWGSRTLASHTAKRSMRYWTNWPTWWISVIFWIQWNHLFILCNYLCWTMFLERPRAAHQAQRKPSHQEANICCPCWHWYHRRHLLHGGTQSLHYNCTSLYCICNCPLCCM